MKLFLDISIIKVVYIPNQSDISLQPEVVNFSNFKLRFYDLTEFIF